MNKETFREYLDALERVDTEALINRFYHQDLEFRAGDVTMDRAGLLEFETSLKSMADFRFDVRQIVADESGIAIDTTETFDILVDADVPNIGPARKGERWQFHQAIFYTLRGGRISRINVNVLSVEKIN